jgi:hypothetical protein
VGLGLLQQRDHLLPLHAGKTVEKILNGIARREVVEKALYRHAGSLEDGVSTQDIRILHNDLAHAGNVGEGAPFGELIPLLTDSITPSHFPIVRYTPRFNFMKSPLSLLFTVLAFFLLGGCVNDMTHADYVARAAMDEAIKNEPPGNYFIGRRYYKVDYKMWGFVRSPGQPWKTAKLVMMNEQQKLAPDREKGILGSDHGYEYKLYGYFSGQTVYEPASNSFYPEFVLTGYELISTNPAPILRIPGSNDPVRRIIEMPQ